MTTETRILGENLRQRLRRGPGGSIDIWQHGETYARATRTNKGYEFAISADGGVGLLDTYGTRATASVRSKYPPTSSANMNGQPSGGFGGLGIIQLMAPPGDGTNADETNTLLDDNINILK